MRFLVFLLLLGGTALALWHYEDEIPRHWNPRAPLMVDDPLTLITKWKLRQLDDDREECLAALDTVPDGELSYTPLDDYVPVAGCPLENVVRMQASSVSFDASFVASCPLALAWVIFERQRLQPAAQEIFATSVSRVEHYGSFACRNIYHREVDRRSEHATAEAFDVAAFVLGNGRRIVLLNHWDDEDEAGAFLREARDGACDVFGNVLGPDYNQAHADHFHFGMRGFRLCR